ncbi:Deoxycytidine monophosphate (dCMP) deaminase [Kickxella alabastrina]|uniref:Deoxycytidine monophosphate (dCMP) deaminase n=1 Tax=Kickxella alabastrina TaxID=61397 RepID=A0ACC1IX85_9FUNG|nr:Deoxycytidine monophosphate (dCMP) deaminase [Kickxella alabastrina]
MADGKEEVASYLVRTMGFTRLHISNNNTVTLQGDLAFQSTKRILEYVTPRWRTNFVTTDVTSPVNLYLLWKRPFVLVVGIDAPTGTRYNRHCAKRIAHHEEPITLENFVELDDRTMYACEDPPRGAQAINDLAKELDIGVCLAADAEPQPLLSSIIRNASAAHELNLKRVLASANVSIANTFDTLADLYAHLEHIDLTNPERIRPSWDTYFMLLSELASHRANCMKRKVGCILVKDNQIIATGYNGTPKGITNCNEGGCPRCNDGTPCGVSLDHCLCIHAEENALLEAGRGRVRNAIDVVLYCNTCPCLGCAKKIVQVGVKVVVYSKGYGMDELTLKLFKEAKIVVRQHTPPTISMEIGSP